MKDDLYMENDLGLEIDRISEAEANEYNDIEGIETDEEYAFKEDDEAEGEEKGSNEDPCSTPEHPLYDPETRERIPYGMTMKEWKKRKRAAAKKKAAAKALNLQKAEHIAEVYTPHERNDSVKPQTDRQHHTQEAHTTSDANASEATTGTSGSAVSNSEPIRSDTGTQGTYGDRSILSSMLDNQSVIDALKDYIDEKSAVASGSMHTNQKGEPEPTDSKSTDNIPLSKHSREKPHLPSYTDTARDGFEALGMIALNTIKSADESEENDVKRGFKEVKHTTDHFRMILGTSGMLAAASLDAAMGARQSDLMDKCISKGIDPETLTRFVASKVHINDQDNQGIKKVSLKEYKKGRAVTIKYLQSKGFTKYEARDILKKSAGGQSVAETLSLALKARTELLDAVKDQKIRLTDEEQKFLDSKAFFNTAKNSKQISALTRKYFDSCQNPHLKDFNPATGYLSAIRSRENSRRLGPNIIGRPGIISKASESLDPHTYNLKVNLSKEVLRNRYRVKLDRVIKKHPEAFTEGQKTLLAFQETLEKQASYIERRRLFKKNKYSIKNVISAGLTCFRELDSDTAKGLDQVLSVKNGAEAAYSLMRLSAESVWVASKPLRIIADKTGLTGAVKGAVEKKKVDILFALKAKKKKIVTTARKSTAGKSLGKAKATLKTSKPAIKVASRRSSIKATKQTITKAVTYRRQRIRNRVMNNPVARIILSPFKGVAAVSRAINDIKDVFCAVGHWGQLAVGVTIVIWLILLFIAGFLMTLGNSLDITGHYVIMADQELIEKWVNTYLLKDDTKYEEAVSHAEDEPIDPHAWGGTRLYHYGVYEHPNDSYFNRNYTNCYYHEKNQQKHTGAANGFHVIYIDSKGNTLGNNTTNVKDVLSLATVMAGNDWYSYQAEAEDLMDKIYLALNPEPAIVESEIYACSAGCDTYPRKHTDGDPDNGNNWYQWAYRAYQCNDAGIYAEYERLLSEGVRFFPDDTYTYSSREYYERLVPQTIDGCNRTADLHFDRVKVKDGYYSNYITTSTGHRRPDYSSWVPAVYAYKLTGIDHNASCGGQTYGYKYDDGGYYYRNTETEPDTYASMYYTDDEHIEETNNAGFYGRYSRDYSNTIPHTAIKCCYGHKDLNIYITVLTKEDLINAKGGSIEYRVPVHFSHETGEITEWETKYTMNINTYTRTNTNLQELTKVFYEKGGFSGDENTTTLDQVFGEDWYELYGINIYSGAAIPDTLSREAKTNRLDYAALSDVSEIRTNLVSLAYGQVGKIPYYWGGKASSTNLYANDFGSKVKPDYKGRSKKGLDCSGFVQLMFCMASGAELNEVGSTTSSLVPSLGLERVSFSDLLPGDIGMENLPGADSNHIGIYAGNGMWIHCQGAPANTVVYNNTNCFKYYYSLGR